jgi:hypothetical protein
LQYSTPTHKASITHFAMVRKKRTMDAPPSLSLDVSCSDLQVVCLSHTKINTDN